MLVETMLADVFRAPEGRYVKYIAPLGLRIFKKNTSTNISPL